MPHSGHRAQPAPIPPTTSSLCSVCVGVSPPPSPSLSLPRPVCVQKLRFLLCRRFTFFISLVGLWHMTVTVRQHTHTHTHARPFALLLSPCSCSPFVFLLRPGSCYQSDLPRTLQIRELHHANISLLTYLPSLPHTPTTQSTPHLRGVQIYLPKNLFRQLFTIIFLAAFNRLTDVS